ncbi:hypothetical protein AAE478_003215 [Parahypoxylon ruwenzoriense]
MSPVPTNTRTFAGVPGYLTNDGRFWCIACGRGMKYTYGNVRTHFNRFHDPNSRYVLMRSHFETPIHCAHEGCAAKITSRLNMVQHYRNRHGLRGSSTRVLASYGRTHPRNPSTRKEESDNPIAESPDPGAPTPAKQPDTQS